jgi:nucleotide-binding universal stress UspA family protein
MSELESIGEKHILVATDDTDSGERAVLYVADILGGLPGFRATVLNIVLQPPGDFFASATEESKWVDRETRKGRELVDKYRDLLVQAGFPAEKVDSEVVVRRADSLSSCILSEVERLGACTVAVGRRGLSNREEFLQGSTSSRLLHSARNCALWVVE